MLSTIPGRLSFVIIGLLMVSTTQADIYGHHQPYQDQHFNLDSTRRTYSTEFINSTAQELQCEQCLTGNCRPGHICPPVDTASLQLYVPDELQVEINGQRTRPQTLGGIHRNSRIFLLEDLAIEHPSGCKIVVHGCDDSGDPTQYTLTVSVRAGKSVKVRYPQGFTEVSETVPVGAVPVGG